MKLSCGECRQQLGELMDGELHGDVAANADVRAHVAGCAGCRRELALLQAARNELRAFPIIAAPTDMRERVRAQIATMPKTPRAVPSTRDHSVRHRRENTKQGFSRRVADFFRSPANLAWTSSMALSVFCLVLLARPGRQIIVESPMYDIDTQAETSSARTKAPNNAAPAATKKAAAKKSPNAKPSAPATQPLPIEQFPPFNPQLGPEPTDRSTDFGSGFFAPSAQNPVRPDAPRSEDRPRPSSGPAVLKPEASTPPRPKAASGTPQNFNDDTRPIIEVTPPTMARHNTGAKAGERASKDADEDTSATMMARAPMEADAPRPENGSLKASGGASADSVANTGPMGPAGVLRERTAKSALASRRVTARIVSPVKVNWGQISVVLPAGVRFSDGSRARVIWRGAVEAGEKIAVPFDVQAASGAHSIRLTLQQIKNGEAQHVTSESISLTIR